MSNALRARYMGDTVATVPPARLVTMLYDALSQDLKIAEGALREPNLLLANDRLSHAQAIVTELRVSLDPSKWEGGPGLAALYDFISRELIAANVGKDAAKVRSVRRLVEPLRDAWHQAAATIASS